MVKLLWDADTHAGLPLKVVLLGSAPLLIQRGLTESLAGRFEVIPVPHWSFAEIVGHLLDSHDALRDSEQGQSFFAFWNLLLSGDRQQQFQEQVDQVVALAGMSNDHRSNQLLRRLISHLLREGEKVVESHQRMSTNLRRVLDTTHLNERRQVGELLQAIRNAALKLRDTPPEGDEFFHIEDFPDVFTTMSRPLWQAPESVALTGDIENDTEELGLDELRRFRNLPQIRLEKLRRNVTTCLQREKTVTLQHVLDVFPPRHGMMEVAGYIVVAANDPHHYVGEDTQILEQEKIPHAHAVHMLSSLTR